MAEGAFKAGRLTIHRHRLNRRRSVEIKVVVRFLFQSNFHFGFEFRIGRHTLGWFADFFRWCLRRLTKVRTDS